MSKEKGAPKVSKKDKISKLLKKRVYDIFDRRPNGSVRDAEVGKLSEEIEKL